MKNPPNLRRCFLILSIGLMFTACQKEDVNTVTGPDSAMDNSLTFSLFEKNEMIEDYAFILAQTMSENDLRSKIKAEAKLMFDGDYDILVSSLENRLLYERGITVKKLLLASS